MLTVLEDREITLDEGMELIAEVDRVWFFVVIEEVFNGHPKIACALVRFHGDVEDVVVDGAVDPPKDGIIGLDPKQIGGGGRRGAINVGKKPKLAVEGLEEGCPLVVVWVVEFKDDGNVSAHRDSGIGASHSRRKGVVEDAGSHGRRGVVGRQHVARGIDTVVRMRGALLGRQRWAAEIGKKELTLYQVERERRMRNTAHPKEAGVLFLL